MDVAELARELLEDEDPVRCLGLAERTLEGIGFEIARGKEPEPWLVARRGEGGVLLSGHVDVVPPGEGWTRDPFGGEPEGDRFFGRGSSDMRGPVACMLAAARAIDPTIPLSIVLTTDEERTMATARRFVADAMLPGCELIVVGEPTGLDVATAGKGVLWVTLHVEGARGHGSTPRKAGEGACAPERLVELVAGLDPEPLRLEHPDLGPTTARLTGLSCEQTPPNVLAGYATARLDCRFPPPGTPQEVEQAIRSKLELPQEGVEVEVTKREPAFMGAKEAAEALVPVLERAGVNAKETAVLFASEAGHYQRVAPTVILGPGSIDRAHKPDEFITEQELSDGQAVYEAIARWCARDT